MVMILTHLYFHFLSPLLFDIQRNLSEDMDTTYHACSEREWFANFENLDGGFVLFGYGHTAIWKGYV